MGKLFLVTFISILTFLHTFGQKTEKHNELSFSATFFSNRTSITAGNGPFREKKGKILSNGVNATYSRTIVKDIFIIIGAGLYKQNIEIARPINYNDFSTRLLYHTRNYNYDYTQSFLGIGYNYYIKKNYFLKGSLTYNQFNTNKQKYEVKAFDSTQNKIINSDLKYLGGKSYNLSFGGRHFVSKFVSFGLDILLPIHKRWRKDKMFWEDPNEYYTPRPKLTAGINVSASCHF